jgi:hypothetical protein
MHFGGLCVKAATALRCHRLPAGTPIISLFSGDYHIASAINLLVGENCLCVGLSHLVRCC